jgi:hypothetical protein
MGFIRDLLAGRAGSTAARGSAAAGGALVADGLTGIDEPFGRKRVGLFGSLFVIAVGLVFVGAGFFIHQKRTPFPDGRTTTGTVTGIETTPGSGNRTTQYSRVVTFTTADGTSVSATEPISSSSRPETGETVTVSYRPADPQSARIIPDRDWLFLGVVGLGGLTVLIGLGTFLLRLATLVTGIALLIAAWRNRRRTT